MAITARPIDSTWLAKIEHAFHRNRASLRCLVDVSNRIQISSDAVARRRSAIRYHVRLSQHPKRNRNVAGNSSCRMDSPSRGDRPGAGLTSRDMSGQSRRAAGVLPQIHVQAARAPGESHPRSRPRRLPPTTRARRRDGTAAGSASCQSPSTGSQRSSNLSSTSFAPFSPTPLGHSFPPVPTQGPLRRSEPRNGPAIYVQGEGGRVPSAAARAPFNDRDIAQGGERGRPSRPRSS